MIKLNRRIRQRNPVSSSCMDSAASFASEGIPRNIGLVNALPRSSYRPALVGDANHSHTLPTMS